MVFGKSTPLNFVGSGRVASALAWRLSELGYKINLIISRSERGRLLADSLGVAYLDHVSIVDGLTFVCVPDDVLSDVLSLFSAQAYLVHTSGVHSLDVFGGENLGVGSFHPAYPFSLETRLRGDEGMLVGVESSDSELRDFLFQLARDIGGNPVDILQGKKVLYHAAAVMASNYLVTLFDVSCRMYVESGLSPNLARQAVLGLMQGVFNNLSVLDSSLALTGPISRGDIQTVEKHLSLLFSSDYTNIYKILGLSTLPLAKNLDPEIHHKLFELLSKDS